MLLLFGFGLSPSAESQWGSSWRWKFKCVKKHFFCKVETLLFVHHFPWSAEKWVAVCVCVCALCVFGERQKTPGLRKYDAVHECMIFYSPLSYYFTCILKVCLLHAWLTFILAITCKGKWSMNPLGIIELIEHIYFSVSLCVSFKVLESFHLVSVM